MADGSKNHTAGGGGAHEQGPAAGAGASPPSARLRAEEMVERGLRLYAHGDLIGALAEWRRALEIDRSNRRGRDYVTYVEDHFELLTQKFQAARAQREAAVAVEPLGLAIEIEADDPMEDMSPYESIELEGRQGRAAAAAVDEDDGEGTSPAPDAPHLAGQSAGGKVVAGRNRPWGRRQAVRDADQPWPLEESWPSASRSNDTLEMTVDPRVLDDLDELDAALDRAVSDPGDGDEDGDEDDDEDEVDDGADELAADAADTDGGDGAADRPYGDELDAEGPDGDEGVSVEEPLDRYEPPSGQTIDDVLQAVEEEDTGPGESTQPSRAHRGRPYAQRTIPTAEGSGPLDASRLAAHHFGAAAELSDADIEAWADGTPPVESIERLEREGVDLDDHRLSRPGERETPEVRVTFRRSPRTTAPPLAAQPDPAAAACGDSAAATDAADDDADAAALATDAVRELGTADADVDSGAHVGDEDDDAHELRGRSARDTGEDRDDRDFDRDDDEVDEEELTIERHGVSSRVSQVRRQRTTTPVVPLRRTTTPVLPRRTTTPVPPRGGPERDGERATTELAGRRRPMAHVAISIDLVSADLLAELDGAMAEAAGAADEQLRTRVGWLIDRARRENREGRYPTAVVAVDLALDENPESAVAQKLIHSNRELLYEIYGNYLGDMRAVPGVAMPMSAIPMSELDHRAAFLLSRVDGVLSLEDVLDVAGMARLEAFRHLSRLMLRGILEIRP